MKYIRLYENKKYNVNDYVLLNIEKLDEEGYSCDGLGKIIKKLSKQLIHPYLILFDNNHALYLEEDKIERFLTSEEIEKFETILAAKKYNL